MDEFVDTREIEHSEGSVTDSENFIRYIKGLQTKKDGSPIFSVKESFPKSIDLGFDVKSAIDEMYQTQKPKSPDKEGGKKDVEAGRVVYVDIQTDALRATDIVYGEELGVDLKSAYTEALGKKGLPLIPIHTHPNRFMLTPDDYLTLVSGDKERGVRLSNAEIVVLPDGTQVMAVATKDTPFFDTPDEAEKYLDDVNQKIVDQATHDVIGGGEQDITENALNIVSHSVNASQVSLATEMGVKLYFSSNGRNFNEFSA